MAQGSTNRWSNSTLCAMTDGDGLTGKPSRPVSDGPSQRESARGDVGRVIRSAVPVVIVVAVVAAMLWSTDFGLRAAASTRSRSNVAFWEIDSAYYSCLAKQVEGVVPRGEAVWVSYDTPYAPFWYRSLWKVVAAYRPVTAAQRGTVQLYLVKSPHDWGCLGTRVKAVFPDGAVKYGQGFVPHPLLVQWRSLGSPSLP